MGLLFLKGSSMENCKLSIIIPCYNCQETLGEALTSVYTQNLTIPFEVVMVDDGSTDGTKELMMRLASKYPNIKCVYHEKNRGGGAARNTAIKNASGDTIFCLDSDDILPPGTLSKMHSFLKEKNCDAVGIHRSIKFNGTNIKDIAVIHTFGYASNRVTFESLIEKKGVSMNPLYSTFMHTRKAFDITGGYPEDHGFDTQSFAWRFLANGLIAYTCPDAEYLHRINFHKSYYIREAEAGKVNLNWFKIFDEFLFLFSDAGKKSVLSFKFNDYTKNIYDSLKKIGSPFVENLERYTKPYCKDNKIKEIEGNQDKEQTMFDLYWLGSELLRRKNVTGAQKALLSAKEKGFTYPIIKEKLYLCEQCLLGKAIEEEQKKINLKKQKMLPWWKYMLKIVKNILKGIKESVYDARIHIKVRIRNRRFVSLCLHLIILRILRAFKFRFNVKDFDNRPVDTVIITTSKDYELLERHLESLKENLRQDINKIYLVSLPQKEIMDFCASHNVTFIDERWVLGYGKESITYTVNGADRSGWIFQQLLKLSSDKFVEMENYIIVDSDTILINKSSFLEKGKFIFFENEEWHEPYFRAFKKMFGYSTKNGLSFTSHMMIFNIKNLKLMKNELENKHGMAWDKVYLSNIDEKEMSCISDYDTYANWVLCNFPEKVITEPLYNTSFNRTKLLHLKESMKNLKNEYKSISFHGYIKE